MKLAPYPSYKPSGMEWLGDVPEHWGVKRGRFCCDINPPSARLRGLSSDQEVSFVPMEAIGEYGGLVLDQTRVIADVGSGYTEFEDGDVVVAKITPCFENGKGRPREQPCEWRGIRHDRNCTSFGRRHSGTVGSFST
ncbi:MAG: hypothetical protein M5U09_28240 [Gammaproteobacteria bacterium]|nr:hypothetical protein [Gammaproteobacteria bacterium]